MLIDEVGPFDRGVVVRLLVASIVRSARDQVFGPKRENGGAGGRVRRPFLVLRIAPDVELPVVGCLGGVMYKAGEECQAVFGRSLGVSAPVCYTLAMVDQEDVGLAQSGGSGKALVKGHYHRHTVPSPAT
jgi:hypothetical protein